MQQLTPLGIRNTLSSCRALYDLEKDSTDEVMRERQGLPPTLSPLIGLEPF